MVQDFQIKYHFDADSKDKSGETVIEILTAEDVAAAARVVEQAMIQSTFVIQPAFGAAKDGGLVIIQTTSIRYVEIIPMTAGRVPL